MNGNLILNEKPLLIIPSLAKTIGLNESIILQQLHYWLQRTNNIRENRKWVYFTYRGLEEQFPFFLISTIRRAISKLERFGFLSSGNFNKMKMDQTKWYSINYENLDVLMDGDDLTLNPVMDTTTSSEQEEISTCSNGTGDLLIMESPSVQDEQMKCSTWAVDASKLNKALPENSTKITSENTSETSSSSKHDSENKEEGNPYHFFKQNGFGTMGNYYKNKIQTWCVDLSADLVIEAMKVALENGSKRWNYVEAVLNDWFTKGYQTVNEILDAQLLYKKQKQLKTNNKPIRKELIPDWLEKVEKPDKPVFELDFEAKKRLFEERLKA